jgi:hypothetical protein
MILKSICDVNLLSKLSIIFKEWRVMNNVDRGGVIVLWILISSHRDVTCSHHYIASKIAQLA